MGMRAIKRGLRCFGIRWRGMSIRSQRVCDVGNWVGEVWMVEWWRWAFGMVYAYINVGKQDFAAMEIFARKFIFDHLLPYNMIACIHRV